MSYLRIQLGTVKTGIRFVINPVFVVVFPLICVVLFSNNNINAFCLPNAFREITCNVNLFCQAYFLVFVVVFPLICVVLFSNN